MLTRCPETPRARWRVAGQLAIALLAAADLHAAAHADEIQPYAENPWYWQLDGKPTLLLGGFDTASPHEWAHRDPERLIADLDTLQAVGGNYLRSIMYTRDHHHPERVTPWGEVDDGVWDLTRFNADYWDGLDTLLEETAKRGIVVQLEFFDGQNFQRRLPRWAEQSQQRWDRNPMHPHNNVNYCEDNTTLPAKWVPSEDNEPHPILKSVPAIHNDTVVLEHLEAYVGQILDRTLKYDHVLYTITNETWAPQEWSDHWAAFLRGRAAECGRTVNVADSRFWPTTDPMIEYGYDFADISQVGQYGGARHYELIRREWEKVAAWKDGPRPINSIKQYGVSHGGDAIEGVHRIWRTIFAGQAAARFHRPPWGAGLDESAQASIRGLRELTDRIDVFNVRPHQQVQDLLGDRADDEAYLMADPGRAYAVYFTNGGEVTLDITAIDTSRATVKWLNVTTGEWTDPAPVNGPQITLAPRSDGPWAAVILP